MQRNAEPCVYLFTICKTNACNNVTPAPLRLTFGSKYAILRNFNRSLEEHVCEVDVVGGQAVPPDTWS